LHKITKQYVTNSEALAVLHIYSSQFTAQRLCIVGENGSGKSTLLLAISGLLGLDAGAIEWQGTPVSQLSRKQLFAIASDSIIIPEFLSAKQVIELNIYTWKVQWPEDLISRFNFTIHVNKTIDALSAGNLKKLQLICALMRKRDLLLLDEPNIALDEASVKVLWDVLDAYPGMIIVTSNEANLFEEKGFKLNPLHETDTC
jgi:ABC-2 type transport system ATP-binding protein